MKILVDAHVFDEPHQGTRTYLKGLYSMMVKLMPDTSFFFACYDLDSLTNEIGTHSNVFFLQLKKKKVLRLLIEIPLLIKKHKIDYAHFQYVTPLFKNCKFIVTTHDILFMDLKELFPMKYRIVKGFLFKVSAMRADILLTVSEYSRQSISKHFKIPQEKIKVTPNGVSSVFYDDSIIINLPDISLKYNLGKYIVFVSRIEPRKNHLLLLKAFIELRLWKEGYNLVFIGKMDIPYIELSRYLDSLAGDSRKSIVHIERCSNDELMSFYKHAKLFVYPSIAEGFGIPPLEAACIGTPTLCSNSTAMSDFKFLEDNLFDPLNLIELKNKMSEKLIKPIDREEVERSREFIAKKYDWKNSAEVLMKELYNR
jgi:glycosyltransferase involved in cell wall biosynthesis